MTSETKDAPLMAGHVAVRVAGDSWRERWAVLAREDALELASKRGGTVKRTLLLPQASAWQPQFDLQKAVFELHAPDVALRLASLDDACAWAGRLGVPGLAALSASHPHAARIGEFYAAFDAKEHEKMADAYADDAVFEDNVFGELDAQHVRGMWRMFCRNGSDLHVQGSGIAANDRFAVAHWDAQYNFGPTKRRVENSIDAVFELRADGKTVMHVDSFSFRRWAGQAFGFSGGLLGLSSHFRYMIGSKSRRMLESYLEREKAGGAAEDKTVTEADEKFTSEASAPAASASLADESQVITTTYVEKMAHPAAAVWKLAGSWLDIGWTGVVRSVDGDDASKSSPPQPGAVRTVSFSGTPEAWTFKDELVAQNDDERTQTFRSISSPLPMRDHTATIAVRDLGNGKSTFEWTAKFRVAESAPPEAAHSLEETMRRLQMGAAQGLAMQLSDTSEASE